jgi:hypothetical protein
VCRETRKLHVDTSVELPAVRDCSRIELGGRPGAHVAINESNATPSRQSRCRAVSPSGARWQAAQRPRAHYTFSPQTPRLGRCPRGMPPGTASEGACPPTAEHEQAPDRAADHREPKAKRDRSEIVPDISRQKIYTRAP